MNIQEIKELLNKQERKELLIELLTEYIIDRDSEILENKKKELELQEQKEIIYKWLENAKNY